MKSNLTKFCQVLLAAGSASGYRGNSVSWQRR